MSRHLLKLAVFTLVAFPLATSHAELRVSALLSMVGRNHDAQFQSNQTNFGITPFDAAYGRIFLDAAVSDRLSAFMQWFAHDYDGAFFYGAYLRYDHTPDMHLEAGLIPVPIGLWAPRTYANKNPLVSVPAIYQYKTSVQGFGALQTTSEALLENRGLVDGAPIIYDFCWNTGVHAYASHGQFDFGVAVLNGSLGMPKREVVYGRPAIAAHVNWIPTAYATLGAWVSGGPWMSPNFESALPPGDVIEDYNQFLAGGLLQASAGHAELNAEVVANRFEHPYLGDLDNVGGYADLKYSFATRWWTAARVDVLNFSEMDAESGSTQKWDYSFTRLEFGVGRRLTEKALIKGVTQLIRYAKAPKSLDGEVFALQLTVEL